MISCFTVTQEGRLPLLAQAIADFQAQSVRDRELVIVHDGAPSFHNEVLRLAAQVASAPVRVARAATGHTLGTLRNVAIDFAQGEYVCQWDDDDRCHPQRLEAQLDALRAANADCSFFSDQLHFFADAREMYWDDWHAEPYPLNFAPGSLFARRSRLARYPDLKRGEDTEQALAMLRDGRRFERIRDQGYLHIYVFHGRNTFDQAHHASISYWGCYRRGRLLPLESLLRARLTEYSPPLGPFVMPYEGGRLEFAG